MKMLSSMFLIAEPGTPGRKSTRRLNDDAVARAQIETENIKHQMKFMSPGKRLATALALTS